MSPETESKHIAFVGITGVGKSTAVNLLLGSNCAPTSNGAKPCTSGRKRYDIEEKGITYALWDTRGLDEAFGKETKSSIVRSLVQIFVPADAEEQLGDFLRGTSPKVHLVVFCIHAKKIHVDAQWKRYEKIYDESSQRNIKVAVVVTQIDLGTWNTEDWRTTCQEKAKGAVGIEGVPNIGKSVDTEDCKSKILKLIFDHS